MALIKPSTNRNLSGLFFIFVSVHYSKLLQSLEVKRYEYNLKCIKTTYAAVTQFWISGTFGSFLGTTTCHKNQYMQ